MNEREPHLDPQIVRQRTWIEEEISRCEREKFYGQLTIKYEAGKIVTAKREETLKPPPCRQ